MKLFFKYSQKSKADNLKQIQNLPDIFFKAAVEKML